MESVHQESPRSDIFRKRVTSFQMKVNFAFWKSRSQSLEEGWRGTESMLLEVQCEVSSVCDDLGCHVICWCWSTVFSEVYSQRSHLPGHFRALHASFWWQALWRYWFNFSAGLGTSFTLCEINLYNIWVSLSEMSNKKILTFFMIF